MLPVTLYCLLPCAVSGIQLAVLLRMLRNAPSCINSCYQVLLNLHDSMDVRRC